MKSYINNSEYIKLIESQRYSLFCDIYQNFNHFKYFKYFK